MAHAVQSGVLAALAGAVGKMALDFSGESHVARFVHIGDASPGLLERILSVPGNFGASLIRSAGQTWMYRTISGTPTIQSEIASSPEQGFEWSLRALLILLMLILNSCMLSSYVYALEKSGSALRATVVNFASNFLCSILLSLVWFGEDVEKLSKCQWLTGCGMILGGVGLVVATGALAEKKSTGQKREESVGEEQRKNKDVRRRRRSKSAKRMNNN